LLVGFLGLVGLLEGLEVPVFFLGFTEGLSSGPASCSASVFLEDLGAVGFFPSVLSLFLAVLLLPRYFLVGVEFSLLSLLVALLLAALLRRVALFSPLVSLLLADLFRRPDLLSLLVALLLADLFRRLLSPPVPPLLLILLLPLVPPLLLPILLLLPLVPLLLPVLSAEPLPVLPEVSPLLVLVLGLLPLKGVGESTGTVVETEGVGVATELKVAEGLILVAGLLSFSLLPQEKRVVLKLKLRIRPIAFKFILLLCSSGYTYSL
jgi:hypothetical protein